MASRSCSQPKDHEVDGTSIAIAQWVQGGQGGSRRQNPAPAQDAPLPTVSASTKMTLHPWRAHSYAIDNPTTPPPHNMRSKCFNVGSFLSSTLLLAWVAPPCSLIGAGVRLRLACSVCDRRRKPIVPRKVCRHRIWNDRRSIIKPQFSFCSDLAKIRRTNSSQEGWRIQMLCENFEGNIDASPCDCLILGLHEDWSNSTVPSEMNRISDGL